MKLRFAGLLSILFVVVSPLAVFAEDLTCCGSTINVTFPPELPKYSLAKAYENCSGYTRSCDFSFTSPNFKPEGNMVTLTARNDAYGKQAGHISFLNYDGSPYRTVSCGTFDGDHCQENLFLQGRFYANVRNPYYWGFGISASQCTESCLYSTSWFIDGNLPSEMQGGIEFNPELKGSAADNVNTPFEGGDGPGQCPTGSPNYHVNTATLNLVVEDTDYAYDSMGQSIALRRTWNATPSTAGMFGNGWDFSYASKVVTSCRSSTLIKGSGQSLYFSGDLCPSQGLSYPYSPVPPAGVYDTLVLTADNVWQFREKRTKLTFRYTFASKDSEGFSTYVLTGITDRNGNTLQVGYNTDGTISYLRDCTGRTTTFQYGSAKKCTSIKTVDGKNATFVYDTAGNLTRSTDPQGIAATYAYDGDNYLTALTVDGKTTTFEYGTSGGWKHVTAVTNADGFRTQYHAWSNAQVEITDPRKGVSTYFNYRGAVLQMDNPAGDRVSFAYDKGLLTSLKDGRGGLTVMEYDGRGNMAKKTDALGKITAYSYDGDNNLLTYTSPLGETFTYTYDGKGNLTGIRSPAGRTTAFAYNSKGLLTAMTDSNGHSTTFTYDGFGNQKTRTDVLGNTTTFGYDSAGINLVSVKDPRGNTTSFAYDRNRRLTRITNADGTYREFGYDACAMTGMSDENGHHLTMTRDKRLHVTGISDAMNGLSAYTYDGNGNAVTATDPLGNISAMTYDTSNRIAVHTDPSGETVTFTRDANGNITTLQDERHKATGFTFDGNDKTLSITDPLSRVTSITRDDLGRPKTKKNGRGDLIGFSYDSDGGLTAKSHNGTTVATYSYDKAGNLVSFTDAGGTTTYVYNGRNEVTGITYPDGKAVTFTYDGAGNMVTTAYPGGLTLTGTVSSRNRVEALRWDTGDVSFTYDGPGNLLSETRSNGTGSEYVYDLNNRVASIRHRKGATAVASMDYTRDAAGNVVRETIIQPVAANPALRDDYGVYDDGNRITSFGGSTYAYDTDGNLTGITGRKTFTSSYDPENRPVQMTSGGITISYGYDGLGNRVRAVRGAETTGYYHDHRGRLLFEADGSGRIVNYYIHKDGRLVAMRTTGGASYFYHYDRNGNTVLMTGQSGTTMNAYGYTPYGEVAGATETIANRFKYTGSLGVMDEGNGIYFMKNRYYDAVTGRFLQKDPIAFAGGQTNLYAYPGGNPVMFIDPEGTVGLLPLILGVGLTYIAVRGTVEGVSESARDAVNAVRNPDNRPMTLEEMKKNVKDANYSWSDRKQQQAVGLGNTAGGICKTAADVGKALITTGPISGENVTEVIQSAFEDRAQSHAMDVAAPTSDKKWWEFWK